MNVEQLKLPPTANRVELAVQSLWNAMDDLMAVPAEELVGERIVDAQGRTLGAMAILEVWRADIVRKQVELSRLRDARPPYNRSQP